MAKVDTLPSPGEPRKVGATHGGSVDRKELEAWLKTRPREDAILIAQRAAMRAFPVWASQMREDWAQDHDLTCTTALRCYVGTGVFGKYPAPEIASAASASAVSAFALTSAASASAFAASDSAAASAVSAASVASATDAASASGDAAAFAFAAFAASDRVVFWASTEQDVAIQQSGGDLLAAPLWHGDPPALWLKCEPQALDNLTLETGDPNSFGHRWWRGAGGGIRPMARLEPATRCRPDPR